MSTLRALPLWALVLLTAVGLPVVLALWLKYFVYVMDAVMGTR